MTHTITNVVNVLQVAMIVTAIVLATSVIPDGNTTPKANVPAPQRTTRLMISLENVNQ